MTTAIDVRHLTKRFGGRARRDFTVTPIETSLEDVFIDLMQKAPETVQ